MKGYIWAPQNGADGRIVPSWSLLKEVKERDIVFSVMHRQIVSINTALGSCLSQEKEISDDNHIIGDCKQNSKNCRKGFEVKLEYKLITPISIDQIWNDIKNMLPDNHSPFNKKGQGNQGYLFRITDKMGQYLIDKINSKEDKSSQITENSKGDKTGKGEIEGKTNKMLTKGGKRGMERREWNLDNDGVVIVKATRAEKMALDCRLYVCQNRRKFFNTRYIAFYKKDENGIERIKFYAEILEVVDNVRTRGDNLDNYPDPQMNFQQYFEGCGHNIAELADFSTIFKLGEIKELNNPIVNDLPYTFLSQNRPKYTNLDKLLASTTTSELVDLPCRREVFDSLVEFFNEYTLEDITPDIISKICLKLGQNCDGLVDKLREDPYVLMNVEGIEFSKIDKLAQNMGINQNSDVRIGGLLKNKLFLEASNGHTYQLMNRIKDDLQNSFTLGADFENALVRVIKNKKDICTRGKQVFFYDGEKVALNYYKDMEDYVISNIKSRLTDRNQQIKVNIDQFISEEEQNLEMTFTEDQKKAIKESANNRKGIFLLSGYAGTGKTTISRVILDFCNQNGTYRDKMICCAFTGVAADRIRQKTGYNARTIHSLLSWDGQNYGYNENNRLDYDVILIDESSMINIELFYSLLKAIRDNTLIVMVGDDAQLPPIGPGNVFSDLLKIPCMPKAFLETVVRNDTILDIANSVRNGEVPENIGEFIHEELSDEDFCIIKAKHKDLINKVTQIVGNIQNINGSLQVIIPEWVTDVGAWKLNPLLRDIQNPLNNGENNQNRLRINDKVIHLKNMLMKTMNYSDFQRAIQEDNFDLPTLIIESHEEKIFNGMIGNVVYVDNGIFVVRYSNDADDKVVFYKSYHYNSQHVQNNNPDNKGVIDLAYALVVHKVQGNEFDYVIMVIDNVFQRMLDNKLIYTALTRSKQKFIFIGQLDAIMNGIGNRMDDRNTFLNLAALVDFCANIDNQDNAVRSTGNENEIEHNIQENPIVEEIERIEDLTVKEMKLLYALSLTNGMHFDQIKILAQDLEIRKFSEQNNGAFFRLVKEDRKVYTLRNNSLIELLHNDWENLGILEEEPEQLLEIRRNKQDLKLKVKDTFIKSIKNVLINQDTSLEIIFKATFENVNRFKMNNLIEELCSRQFDAHLFQTVFENLAKYTRKEFEDCLKNKTRASLHLLLNNININGRNMPYSKIAISDVLLDYYGNNLEEISKKVRSLFVEKGSNLILKKNGAIKQLKDIFYILKNKIEASVKINEIQSIEREYELAICICENIIEDDNNRNRDLVADLNVLRQVGADFFNIPNLASFTECNFQTINRPEEITPTEEQRNIIRKFGQGNNLLIRAFAGTGKTTTLKMLTQDYPTNKTFLYLVFNRSAMNNAQNNFPDNTEVRTVHSFALNHMRENIDLNTMKIRNNEYKAREIAQILTIDDFYAKAVRIIFNEFCYSDKMKIEDLDLEDHKELYPLIKLRGISIQKALDYMTDFYNLMEQQRIQITHNFYLKQFQRLGIAKNIDEYDAVLLDEAQDSNLVTYDIFNKIKANQKVVIGDSHQKIYGFRNGLDIINNFLQNEFTEMPLTISFRFNGEIATIANNLLSNLKSENIRIQGVAPDRNILTKAFITRTNAKIVEIIAGMINNNDWKTVRKPDDLFALPMSITKFFINSGINYRIPEDLSFLRIFNSLQELTEYANDVNDIEMMSAIRIAERKAAVINECFFRARQQYNNLNNASVYLTTAHTSKGLEWDEVYLTDDYPDIIGQIRNAIRINNVEKNIENMDLKDIIRRFIEMQHDDRQYRSIQNIVEEINLLYVAVTRARKIVHVDNVDLFNILDQIR